MNCKALSDEDKWLIVDSGLTGWIENEFLMILSPRCPDCEYDELFKQVENTVIAVYASSYVEPYGCAALTAWHWENRSSSLDLIALLMDAIEVSQYSTPKVKRIALFDTNRLIILLSSEGGDGVYLWGTYAFYMLEGDALKKLQERTFECDVDKDHTMLNADLTTNESGTPVAVYFESHYLVTGSDEFAWESALIRVDTTHINLIEQ